MNHYLSCIHSRAAKQRRPVSELLFEDFCARAGIHLRHLGEDASKTPDYELTIGDETVIAEVKEITNNKDERESDRLLQERGFGKVRGGKPGARVRKKINDAARQIRARTADGHAGILVLYGVDFHGQRHLRPYHVMTAMYGLETVQIAVPEDVSLRPIQTGTKFGGKKKMTQRDNTSISAIGVLVTATPDARPGILLYHNEFAAAPIEPAILALLGIAQYRIDFHAREWVKLA